MGDLNVNNGIVINNVQAPQAPQQSQSCQQAQQGMNMLDPAGILPVVGQVLKSVLSAT